VKIHHDGFGTLHEERFGAPVGGQRTSQDFRAKAGGAFPGGGKIGIFEMEDDAGGGCDWYESVGTEEDTDGARIEFAKAIKFLEHSEADNVAEERDGPGNVIHNQIDTGER